MTDFDNALMAAKKFSIDGEINDIHPYGSGIINDTYLVTTSSLKYPRLIQQRINTAVFPYPDHVMANMRQITLHVAKKDNEHLKPDHRSFELPTIIAAKDGEDYVVDADGGFWRVMSYISRSRTFASIQSLVQAQEVGYVLGTFQRLLSDLDASLLYDTLPGFHITPRYLRQFDDVVSRLNLFPNTAEMAYCQKFIAQRRDFVTVLEGAKEKGEIPLRIVHGDPKLNNILFDENSGAAVSIIDLDTVKSGLIHYDLGDCLRSCCNTSTDLSQANEDVRFDLDICEAILKGYFSEVRHFITNNEIKYCYDAIRLIPFELGLRFFIDYLDGNRYFKIKTPEENLYRAIEQFKLTQSVENHRDDILKQIASIS